MDRKEALKNRLRNKIKEKQALRGNTQQKDNIIDDNLKNLGINNMDQLKEYMNAIKDMDKDYLKSELIKMGLHSEQIEQFFKSIKK